MGKPLPDRQKQLDAFIKTAQYLASLTIQQDIWSEIGKVMINFYSADLVGFAERQSDGEIIGNHWTFSDKASGEKMLTPEIKGIIAEVLESGFLATRLIYTPEPCQLVFLPITQTNRTRAVMLVGHRTDEAFPKEIINIYLAVAGLLGTTTSKLASEAELRRHRNHLEELVKERTSELVEKTAELEQMNILLQEADRLKSVFLASMSHELRTPLNSIIGFTGIILQGMSGEINEEQKKQLTMVKNSANHLLSLISDLLDISKIEAGKVELSPDEFRLNEVGREVVETFLPAVSEKGLELLTDVPEAITLFSDRRRVKQVLMNLVSNAIKFTDQGSVKIAANVLKDEKLEISVSDTGIGIKKEDMNKLFQPFQQIDMPLTKSRKGTGLGLHLTRKLVTLLGGDISAKSEYGRGSEFTFILPLKYKEEQRDEEDTGG